MPKKDKSTLESILFTIQSDLASLKKNVLTKEDAKNFATKDDLVNFATKDDIKAVQSEIKALNAHNVRIENKVTNLGLMFIENLTKWKDELFKKIDKSMGELIKTREENVILKARDEGRQEIRTNLEKRLKNLEDIHPHNRHQFP